MATKPARISGNRSRLGKVKAVERKRLLDCLAERDRLTHETGHYWGIRELALKEGDPIRYERFYSRLHAAAIGAYEAARYVTASPGSREMGEVVWGLLTPEGDAVAISPGFASHLNAGQTAIRFMAEHHYEENPGVRDGDVFGTDDGASGGAPHPGDFYTYVPIVIEDQVIGWAMAVNHIMEVGTPVPGSFSAYAADTFWDGFVVPPMKTGENLRQYTWWEQLWLRRTRAGVSNILDDKMRLAGCAMIHQEVHRIVSEFGLDYYLRAIREVTEETHQVVRENVKMTTLPGRYDGAAFRSVNYRGLMPLAEHANKDQLIHIRQRFRIGSDGSIAASFDGTSHWGPHPFNFYPGGSNVAFYMAAIQTFLYNTKPTSGVTLAIKASYPSGSIYNPDTLNASFGNPWAQGIAMLSLATNATTRSRFSRGFVEEAFTADGNWDSLQFGGTLHDGTAWGATNFEWVGGIAQGAFHFRDGQPLLWTSWTQLPNVGNAEEFEYLIPGAFYVGRKLIPGYCGHGRHRGGIGQGSMFWFVRPGELTASRTGAATCYVTFLAQGMSGAYPAPGVFHVSARGTNSHELVRQGISLPRDGVELLKMASEGVLKASKIEIWRYDMPPLPFADGDLLGSHAGASGGWGDPIERDPQAVLKDVREGWIDQTSARGLCGVVIVHRGENWEVDETATQRRRKEIRDERLAESVSGEEFWRQERQVLLDKRLIEPVRHMYATTVSEKFDFDGDLRKFWALPEDFCW